MTLVSAPFAKKAVDFTLISIGVALIIVSGYFIRSTSYTRKSNFLPSGKILQCIGACKYKSPDDYFWLNASSDLEVLDKSMVFTPSNSTASIILNSGSKLTLYPNSLVQITISKKGATINIIEGKINFDKVSQAVEEKVTIKGVDLPVATTMLKEPMTEISAEPELLVVKSPEVVYFRNSSAIVDIEIRNGIPPFKVYLEEGEMGTEVSSSLSSLAYKIRSPGVYNLKIEDSTGSNVTKLVNVVDLSVPEIKSPSNGDFIYIKSFRPTGTFDVTETEFSLRKDDVQIFQGNLQNFPRNLLPGNYAIAARKVKQAQAGEWTIPVSFKLVDSKRPIIITKNKSLFFNQASLRWKKALPVPHLLTIINEKNAQEMKFTLNEEEFLFAPKEGGDFVWSVRPILEAGLEEKVEESEISVFNTSNLLISPEQNQRLTSDSLKQEVTFKWSDIPYNEINVSLEISDQANNNSYDVTNKNFFSLELKTLKTYTWKLILTTDTLTFTTPENTFEIDATPPSAPIKGDEILFRDSDSD